MKLCDCIKGQGFPWSIGICFKICKVTHPFLLNDIHKRVLLCCTKQEPCATRLFMCCTKLSADYLTISSANEMNYCGKNSSDLWIQIEQQEFRWCFLLLLLPDF